MEEKRHYSVIDPYKRKVTISYKEKVIAKTSNALILKEVGKSVYNPVLYLPKEDIIANLEQEKQRQSHCPIKGDATYWVLKGDAPENYFAWSYEIALPKAKKIQGRIAFNMEYVSILTEPL